MAKGDSSQRFLQSFKEYDAIGKLIKWKKHQVVFSTAFKDFIKDNQEKDTLDMKDSTDRSKDNKNVRKRNSNIGIEVSQFNPMQMFQIKVNPIDYWLHQ